MKKQLLAGILACTVLTGCGAETTAPIPDAAQSGGEVLAYVPLDDRPDNVERVEYLAESVGYQLRMPERDCYRTALDGQALNENGTQFGDRGKLFAWVLEQERAGCDRYVLSMDQLLSGGLVHSRAAYGRSGISVEENGTTAEKTEYDLLAELLAVLTEDGNNTVWLLDSVMRLAPTVGYLGGTAEDYNNLRTYAMQPRPELTGAELNIGNVEADYGLDAAGSVISPREYGLTEAQTAEYLGARARKLDLGWTMLEAVNELQNEKIHVLIGVDDSSEADSIQKNEIALLRSMLREGDALLSGVDDLAFKAVTRMYQEEIGWETGPAAAVYYFGGTEDRPACAYDAQPLTEIVDEHLAFFEMRCAEPQADLHVLVLTQPADAERKEQYCDALIRQLRDDQKNGVPVILIDAGNGQYGTKFHDALTKRTELGSLLSYAGFLDMAIVTGTALSHGVARYARLSAGTPVTEAENRAFARTLADSILKDFCYKNQVRERLLTFVREDLAGNPDNFCQPAIDQAAVLEYLKSGMAAATEDVIDNLEHSNLTVSLAADGADAQTVGWGGIELDEYSFPWERAFEIGMEIGLGGFTEPHGKFLGIYYR